MTQIAVHPYHSETGLSLSSNVARKLQLRAGWQGFLYCLLAVLSEVLFLVDYRWNKGSCTEKFWPNACHSKGVHAQGYWDSQGGLIQLAERHFCSSEFPV